MTARATDAGGAARRWRWRGRHGGGGRGGDGAARRAGRRQTTTAAGRRRGDDGEQRGGGQRIPMRDEDANETMLPGLRV
jgi:hypothetical protein